MRDSSVRARAAQREPEIARRRLVIAASVFTVLAGALVGAWWWFGAVDGQRATVVAQTSRSVEELLSLDYRDSDVDGRLDLLDPAFRDRYAASLHGTLVPAAIARGSVVRTRVADSAVIDESRGEVTLLMFLDRTETTAAAPQPLLTGGRVRVTASEHDGRWLVRDLAVV